MNRHIASIVMTIFLVVSVAFAGYLFYELKISYDEPPQIICESEEIEATVNITNEQLLDGIKAFDKEDGDISHSLAVEGVSKFVEKGVSYVTYAVSDSSQNVTKKRCKIRFTDYTSPTFGLHDQLVFLYGTKTFDLKDYIYAQDCIDGDISRNIKITTVGDVPSIYNIGIWTVKATVTNSMGDTSSMFFDVTVDEQTYTEKRFTPQIVLKDYMVYTKKSKEIEPMDYLDSLVIDSKKEKITESIKNNIKISSDVDYTTPGTYKINYMYTSEEGYTGIAQMIVVVTD